MDFAEQHVDEPAAPQGTNALHQVADSPADEARPIQALHEGAYVGTMLGSDGELSILPLCEASPTVATMSLQPQPTTNAVDEVTDNEDEMLGMPTKEKSSMGRSLPKKRKIVSQSGQEFLETKRQLILSAQQNHPIQEPIIVFRNDYNMANFSTTVEDNLYHQSHITQSVMDGNNGAVSGQFAQLLDDKEPSSFLNFNNHGYIDQVQPIIGHPVFVDSGSSDRPTPDSAMSRMYPPQQVNETLNSGQGSIAMPDPVHKPYPSNFPDSVRLPEHIQFAGQQKLGLNLTDFNTQQLDSPMLQTLQSTSELEMTSQNATSSENTCVSQENASEGPSPPHAQKLGEIQINPSTDRPIKDIAALNGKVYIAYKDNDTLRTYSSTDPFEKQAEVKVNGMKHPRCMASSAEMNCLFISDGESASSNCVWMVKDGDEAVSKKFVEGVECSSLSVTRNGELLILDSKHKCIHLYNSDGRCFCCVKLPNEIECRETLFAVKSLEDSFYVSSAWTMICDKRETIFSMVYKVSIDGDIVKTFVGRAERGSGQLSGFNVTLTVDKYGRVIVYDGGNGRVLMLDSNLQLMTTVVLDNCHLWNHRDSIFHMDTNADLIFQLRDYSWVRYIKIWSLSQSQLGEVQFQPNFMPNSSSSISSKAISGADEFHLLCSIDCKHYQGVDIRGVATLTDSIYVLTKCSIVAFSCRNPWTKKFENYIDGDLCDIASNVSDGCLYVTDKSGECVWSVGIDLRRTMWLEGIGSPYTLSVAKDGSVLILSNKDQNLEIYNKNGLQQKIRLSRNRTLHLRHAVELSCYRGNETYLVCHGLNISKDATNDYNYDGDLFSHEVFVVSTSGDVLQSFGGKFGSGSDKLNLPSHMTLYIDSTILLADCKNNRVMRLNYQLVSQKILLSDKVQCIEKPFRLCYNEYTGQIIIASSNSVDIFEHGNVLRCQGQVEHSSSNSTASTDAYEPETPDVQLIGQIDSQLQKDKDCIGAAVLQEQIYLIYEYVKAVYVHSSVPPYSLLRQVCVENMKYLSCIVASVEHNCVYIAGKNKVWRLLINGEQCETFLGDIYAKFISVTEKGHLVVYSEFYFIGTYNADGICIQVTALGKEFNIRHAVQFGATKILVSCFHEEFKHWEALKEVSHNGAILHTYGPYINEYFECGGMTAGEGDQIFVIDKANDGRVLVFGSGARLLGILLGNNDHPVREIIGVCYIKDKMQLMVIGYDHIDIYQLKNREPQMDAHGRNVNDPVTSGRRGSSDQLLWARMDSDDYPTLRALEQLGDKLYLLYSTYLTVVSRQDFVDKARFGNRALKMLTDRSCNSGDDDGLWDIAASESDLCLYVTDRCNHCVWSVTIDHKTKKWLTDIGSPYTLSVTEEGYLCILSNAYKSLDIYDRSGNRKHSIRLPHEVKYFLHAVQTRQRTYIISWTWKKNSNAGKGQKNQNDDTDDDDEEAEDDDNDNDDDDDDEDVIFKEKHKNCQRSGDSETQKHGLVCEVSSDGSVLRSFSADDSEPNRINTNDSRSFLRLYQPCHLVVDNDDRVFVADYHHSGRVLLLDSQLKFVANWNEKYKLQGYKAKRLCNDKNRKELIALYHRKGCYTYLQSYGYSPSLICI